MSQKSVLKAFAKKHKNELMLDLFEVVRLVGFDEDDDDYYWKVVSTGPHKGSYRISCVGSLIPLKDSLPIKEYEYLDKVFNLNVGFKG